MVKKKATQHFEPISEPEKWEKEGKVSVAQILKRKRDGVTGISVRMGKKVPYLSYPRYGRTVWIDRDLDMPSWLDWFIKTIRKLYYRLVGKEISPSEEVAHYQRRVEELTLELAEMERRLGESKRSEAEQRELLALAKESVKYLEEFKETFERFKNLVKESYEGRTGKEEEIKNTIKKYNWLLGLDCHVEAKNKPIDTQAQIDLHIQTRYGQDRIFEVKSPNLKPFVRKDGEKLRRYTVSPALADGLAELVTYMRKTDVYSSLRTEGTYGIQKASGVILIGYKPEDSEKQILREFNFHLAPHIQIVTYDELIQNIEREIGLMENIKTEVRD